MSRACERCGEPNVHMVGQTECFECLTTKPPYEAWVVVCKARNCDDHPRLRFSPDVMYVSDAGLVLSAGEPLRDFRKVVGFNIALNGSLNTAHLFGDFATACDWLLRTVETRRQYWPEWDMSVAQVMVRGLQCFLVGELPPEKLPVKVRQDDSSHLLSLLIWGAVVLAAMVCAGVYGT